MSSVNKVILVGTLGRDPEVRTVQSGDKVANLSVATSERWKDKASGEKKEKTEWHRVVIWNQHLITFAQSYLSKGSKVYLEGSVETRKYEKDGREHYTTEIVLRPFKSELIALESKEEPTAHEKAKADGYKPEAQDADIPF